MSRKTVLVLLVLLVVLMAPSCAWFRGRSKVEQTRKEELHDLEAAIAEVDARNIGEVGVVAPKFKPAARIEKPATAERGPEVVKPATRITEPTSESEKSEPEEKIDVPALTNATYAPEANVVGAGVAAVNGEIITKEEVLTEVRPDLRTIDRDADLTAIGKTAKRRDVISRTLIRKVERKLAVQEAHRVISPEEAERIETNVERLVADSIRRAGTSTKLEGLLAEKGKTLKEEKQSELDNRLIRALLIREVDAHVDVTPAEMRRHYEEHLSDYENKAQVQIRQLFLKKSEYASIAEATTKARDLREQIRRGADFGKIAKQYSDGPYADKGGLWEFATEGSGTFPRPVEDAAFRLRPKQISRVIVSDIGVHVIKVEDVRPARRVPFAEVQDEIGRRLREQERRMLYRHFIGKLWNKSHVEIHWK